MRENARNVHNKTRDRERWSVRYATAHNIIVIILIAPKGYWIGMRGPTTECHQGMSASTRSAAVA